MSVLYFITFNAALTYYHARELSVALLAKDLDQGHTSCGVAPPVKPGETLVIDTVDGLYKIEPAG